MKTTSILIGLLGACVLAALAVSNGSAADTKDLADMAHMVKLGPGAIDGCGCAHDGRSGMTYGFYPLVTDAAGQKIDFAVLSRIGLYGTTIDDKGALNFPPGIKTAPWTLLEAAHRHMTQVDWVLSKNDWSAAGGAGMAELLGNLRQSIDRLLRTPFPETDWRGTALATFGQELGPSAGDGIALRFERFPATQQDQEALRGFVRTLARDLRAMKPARRLYLMVEEADIVGAADLAERESRPFSVFNLHDLVQQANPIAEAVDPALSRRARADDVRVLVLMQEPTSGQKLLRAEIDRSLLSGERVRMLRDVIPVLAYDALRSGQLNDDIAYFQDNFGGIGFWPLPLAAARDAATGNHVLRAYFHRAGLDGGALATAIDLICPNRAWLRWLAWISSIAAVAAGVTLFRCRGCATRLTGNIFYMGGMVALIVLPLVAIAALVVGDPLLKSDCGVHWLIAALLIAVVIIPGAYWLQAGGQAGLKRQT